MNSANDSKNTSPDDLVKTTSKGNLELSEEQLDKASGGIQITKTVDKSSPILFTECADGKHLG